MACLLLLTKLVEAQIMLIIFNWIGAGIVMIGFMIGAALSAVVHPKSNALAILIAGPVIVMLDVLYRMKAGEGSWFHPRRGGHVCFIPVWLLGFACVLNGFCGLVSPRGGAALANDGAQRGRAQSVGSQSAFPGGRAYAAGSVESPQAPPPDTLKLTMISGVGAHRLASINGEPFAEGEAHKLNFGQSKVRVQCVEIRERSVVAKIAGESHVRELKLGQAVPLVAAQ